MSAKKTEQKKSPPRRSKNGTRRDKFLQFRVSDAEKMHAQKAFGGMLAYAIRAFLFGYPVPERCLLEDEDKRLMFQSLHALFVIIERVFTSLERDDINAAKQMRAELNESFKHLAKLCFSNFSK